MAEDILRELARLQEYATALQRMMAEAQAQAPRRAEGADPSGALHLVLGADGLPESVRVEPDWRQRLDPRRVGEAVVEAFESATGQRMAEWTNTLRDDGWQDKVERLRDEPEAAAMPLPVPRDEPPPRPMDVVVEEVLHAMDHAEQFANPPAFSAQGTGSDASAHLTVTLSRRGLVTCAVDASWAAQQTATDLSGAFGKAIAKARADLARAAAEPGPGERLDRLFDEVLAILHDPRRLTES
jgi:hypothetical protein